MGSPLDYNKDKQKLELLKDIYEHIMYQYDLVDSANENLSDKAMRMSGFSGIVLGLLVNIALKIEESVSFFDINIIALSAGFSFISILCNIVAALVRTNKGLIKPEVLLNKFEENITLHDFWNQFTKVSRKAYEQIKKINAKKGFFVKFGDFSFIIATFFLAIFIIKYLLY
ncbi:MAG: hypothetical protein K9L94_04530 [Candidatus Omnitrophica bacterium]|nr:hypothetical protein [Candidatus Omnitrophota bacterium]